MPPPPIPQKSRARDSLILSNTSRRPSIAALAAEGERARSRSDTVASTTSSQRSKRLGYVPRKTSGGPTMSAADTSTIRPFHFRGPSQLSNSSFVMHSGNDSSSGAVSPVESPVGPRLPLARRRLSSLPEDRRVSRPTSMSLRLATRVYYAIFQLNTPIGNAVRAIKNGTPRKNVIAIERAFFEASASLEELGRRLDQLTSDTGTYRATERDPWIQAIRKKSGHVLAAYAALAGELRIHSRRISQRGEAMHTRNLMLHIYGALVEVNNIVELQKTEIVQVKSPPKSARSSLAASSSRSVTPTQTKPYPKKRLRGATILQPSRLATPGSVPPPVTLSTGRSNTMPSSVTSASMNEQPSGTPRSGESFHSVSMSRSSTQQGNDDSDERAQFETIYLKYQHTCEIASQVLPSCRMDFFHRKEGAARNMHGRLAQLWTLVLEKCDISIGALEMLKERLAMINLKNPLPSPNTQRELWACGERFAQVRSNLTHHKLTFKLLTFSLLQAFLDTALELKSLHRQGHDTANIGSFLRPLHFVVKDTSRTMTESTIYQKTKLPPSGYVTPIPATPLSAALGPAALATVPNTPREGTFTQVSREGTFTQIFTEYFPNNGVTGDGTVRHIPPRYARDSSRGP